MITSERLAALRYNLSTWDDRVFLVAGRNTKTNEAQIYHVEATDRVAARHKAANLVEDFRPSVTFEVKQ